MMTLDNPYGLDALWAQGDLVARATLLILAVMSVSSWTILVGKVIDQSRLLRRARAAKASFWTAGNLREGVEGLAPDSPFRAIALAGMEAAERHGAALEAKIDLTSWVGMILQRVVGGVVSRTQGGLSLLATVGSTAPFVGLFGTVWGIYHALTAIGIAGQASIDKVAGPVGEALIMTAIGLAVAVPAVLGYNLLVRRNKLAVEQVRNFAADLHAALLIGPSEDHEVARLRRSSAGGR